LIGGVAAFGSALLAGRQVDRHGPLLVFRVTAVGACAAVLVYAHLPPASLWVAVAVVALFMAAVGARMVPTTVLVNACPSGHNRGGFLGVNLSVQHTAMGLASALAGLVVGRRPDGTLCGFTAAGYLAVVAGLLSLWVAGWLHGAIAPGRGDRSPKSGPVQAGSANQPARSPAVD
jgi:predicted MFS family arabinose efflux permease